MLRFQSENTYRGKKGNACWNLPESTIRRLMTQLYAMSVATSNSHDGNNNNNNNTNTNNNKNKSNGSCNNCSDSFNISEIEGIDLKPLRRTELCRILENTALNKISNLITNESHSVHQSLQSLQCAQLNHNCNNCNNGTIANINSINNINNINNIGGAFVCNKPPMPNSDYINQTCNQVTFLIFHVLCVLW